MKKILIRSGMSHFDNYEPVEYMFNNLIGGNIGNLVYQYSVMRTLMTEDVEITPDYYDYREKRADEINENYDCYIIPLADAFRQPFIPELRRITKLIKLLKIPVVVIGVGLKAPFEPKINEGFPFDEDVKEFVKAVLEKSSIIGLRGEITSKYLSQLGFKEGIDHMVIGCPSMYAFGRQLNIRETNITKDSKISVNSSLLSPDNVLDFIARSMKDFPNHYFVPQWKKEMELTYAGTSNITTRQVNYPTKTSDPVYMNNRVRYFLNVPSWLEYMKEIDLSFGGRLHGNIVATIAGTPSIIIPKDARMRELTNYHGLTHIWAGDITEKTTLSDVIEKSDFYKPTKKQGENFDNFIDFLDKNELDHIYKDSVEPITIPFDEKISKIKKQSPIVPISACKIEDVVQRLESYHPKMDDRSKTKENALKKKVKNKDRKVREQREEINRYKRTLNRKSVRFALKAASLFEKK